MAQKYRKIKNWSLVTAQTEDNAEQSLQEANELPPNFGVRLGMLAIENFAKEKMRNQATQYGLPNNIFETQLQIQIQKFETQNKINDPEFVSIVQKSAGNKDSVKADEGVFTNIFESLKDEFSQEQCEIEKAIALNFCPAPLGNDFNGGKGQGQTAWKAAGTSFQQEFKSLVSKYKSSTNPSMQQYVPQAGKKAAKMKKAQLEGLGLENEENIPGPLSVGKYESLEQLKNDLIEMGPKKETYQHLMGLVGVEKEDKIKELLSSFFQSVETALQDIYDILVEKGLASPLDADIAEKIMEKYPEKVQQNKENESKTAGLWMPKTNSGLNTVTASSAAYPSYMPYGSGENKMCPKIRTPMNSYVCRFHCLDGLAVDDTQIVCGEAIWRQAVMDKFSREYRNAKGEWVGGYINKRFQVQQDDGGHPALIVPGKRNNPIHEDAWSVEKRMAEQRKDPKDLYNFDQYELLGGPKNKNIEKTAARLSTPEEIEMVKQSDPDSFKTYEEDEEVENESVAVPLEEEKEAVVAFNRQAKKKKKVNPWAICHTTVNKKKNPEKYERCVLDIKEKNKSASTDSSFIKEAMDAMGDNVNVGYVKKVCPNCKDNTFTMNDVTCPKCKVKLTPVSHGEVTMETGAISSPDIRIQSNNIKIKVSSGVYSSSKNGITTFGETAKEAILKLARELGDKDLADLEIPSLEEEANEISRLRQQNEKEPKLELENQDINESMDNINMEEQLEKDIIPTTEPAPVQDDSIVPEEIEGGESEFFTNEDGSEYDDTEFVGLEVEDQDEEEQEEHNWFLYKKMMEDEREGRESTEESESDQETIPWDTYYKNDTLERAAESNKEVRQAKQEIKPHVDASELDSHLKENEDVTHQQELAETEDQADALGAGPISER